MQGTPRARTPSAGCPGDAACGGAAWEHGDEPEMPLLMGNPAVLGLGLSAQVQSLHFTC